jgi:hypothetical protein
MKEFAFLIFGMPTDVQALLDTLRSLYNISTKYISVETAGQVMMQTPTNTTRSSLDVDAGYLI